MALSARSMHSALRSWLSKLTTPALSVTSIYKTSLGVEIVATSVRELSPLLALKRQGETAHATFTTEVHDRVSGERLGIMRWFEEPRSTDR